MILGDWLLQQFLVLLLHSTSFDLPLVPSTQWLEIAFNVDGHGSLWFGLFEIWTHHLVILSLDDVLKVDLEWLTVFGCMKSGLRSIGSLVFCRDEGSALPFWFWWLIWTSYHVVSYRFFNLLHLLIQSFKVLCRYLSKRWQLTPQLVKFHFIGSLHESLNFFVILYEYDMISQCFLE